MGKLIRYIFVLTFALTALCGEAKAQDWVGTNRDDYGNIVRGAYLTNEWFDNWYIGASAGISTATSKVNDARITPQFDFSILKWFTPSVGMRIGYQGFSGKQYLTIGYNPWQINHSPLPFDGTLGGNGTLSYGLAYIHGDLLWNVSNALWGYKRDRIYNLSIYANTGFIRLYDNTPGQGIGSANHDNEWGLGFGLYNTFRITDRLVATLDLRNFSTASRYKTSEGVRTQQWNAFIGVAYNIYRTYWNRAQYIIAENTAAKADAAAAAAAIAALKAEKEDLSKKIAEKEAEIASYANKQPLDDSRTVIEMPYDDLVARAKAADHVVYYYINVDKPNFSELRHLDEYIQAQLEADPNHVFYLTGSADKGTGTLERNTFLCRSRAYGIRDILINDYNVKAENIVIKATVISDKHLDGAYDRCVIIEKN